MRTAGNLFVSAGPFVILQANQYYCKAVSCRSRVGFLRAMLMTDANMEIPGQYYWVEVEKCSEEELQTYILT